MSWVSWGENLSVAMHPNEDGGTTVVVQSACVLPTQLIDFGRNKNNVKALFRDISAALGVTPQG